MSLHNTSPSDFFNDFQSLTKKDQKAIKKFLNASQKRALENTLETGLSEKSKNPELGLSEFTPWLSKCLADILNQKSITNQTVTPTIKSAIPDVIMSMKNEDRNTRSTLSFWPDNSNDSFITRLLKSKSATQ